MSSPMLPLAVLGPRKRVSFRETAQVYFFDRMPVNDRWPSDGKAFGLDDLPLADDSRCSSSMHGLNFAKRGDLMSSRVMTTTSAEWDVIWREAKEWIQLRTSSVRRSGCTCTGRCEPATCECLQAGIVCRQVRGQPPHVTCSCRRSLCPSTCQLDSKSTVLGKRARHVKDVLDRESDKALEE